MGIRTIYGAVVGVYSLRDRDTASAPDSRDLLFRRIRRCSVYIVYRAIYYNVCIVLQPVRYIYIYTL